MLDLIPIAALLLFGAQFDVDGVLIAETRGGQAPLIPNEATVWTSSQALTPTLTLRVEDQNYKFQLSYGPRILWRQTEAASSGQPAILNVATMSLGGHPIAPTVTLNVHANATEGAADYSFLSQALANQPTLPRALRFLSLGAGGETIVRTSERWTVEGHVEGLYHRQIGSSDLTNGGTPFPTQRFLRAIPSLSFALSPVDEGTLSTAVTYQNISVAQSSAAAAPPQSAPQTLLGAGTFQLLTVAPQLAWRTRLSPRQDLLLAAGFSYNHLIENRAQLAPVPFAPTAKAQTSYQLLQGRDFALRTSAGIVVDYFVDPIIGTAGSRGTASGGFFLGILPHWTVGVEGAFSTSLSPKPLNGQYDVTIPGFQYPFETIASAQLPVRHVLSDNLLMEFGARWADRAPHLAAPDFGFRQRDFSVYVLLTATSTPVPKVLLP